LTPKPGIAMQGFYLCAPFHRTFAHVDLANTIAGFADHFTTKELTFTRASGDEIDVKTAIVQKLCVDDVCVTRDQFKEMVAAASASNVPSSPAPSDTQTSSSTSSPDTTSPTITINGDNPAHSNVGDSYADLGATVTDNVDKTLGYKPFLNGTLISNIVIDTSNTGTDTIDYVATDTAGNTSTSTRTVIIEAAAPPPSQDQPATPTDASSTAQ
jgi:hypothetical protein